ncbi:hypothetical protein CEXT_249531 [Caerostris extrusa]|uniref:Uncharacterized protein n=1 Tax=Caerostris extrusa TaxID=172846 RepID=A0AAV4UH50_CAEEX|nr:hypothetical protein CEXT_249531 [Caerostris extrusa]
MSSCPVPVASLPRSDAPVSCLNSNCQADCNERYTPFPVISCWGKVALKQSADVTGLFGVALSFFGGGKAKIEKSSSPSIVEERLHRHANGAAIYCQAVNSGGALNICIDIGDNSCFSLSVKGLTGPSTPATQGEKELSEELNYHQVGA